MRCFWGGGKPFIFCQLGLNALINVCIWVDRSVYPERVDLSLRYCNNCWVLLNASLTWVSSFYNIQFINLSLDNFSGWLMTQPEHWESSAVQENLASTPLPTSETDCQTIYKMLMSPWKSLYHGIIIHIGEEEKKIPRCSFYEDRLQFTVTFVYSSDQ